MVLKKEDVIEFELSSFVIDVCDKFGGFFTDLLMSSKYATHRHAICYILFWELGYSIKDIQLVFNDRASGISYGCARMTEYLKHPEKYKEQNEIYNQIKKLV